MSFVYVALTCVSCYSFSRGSLLEREILEKTNVRYHAIHDTFCRCGQWDNRPSTGIWKSLHGFLPFAAWPSVALPTMLEWQCGAKESCMCFKL